MNIHWWLTFILRDLMPSNNVKQLLVCLKSHKIDLQYDKPHGASCVNIQSEFKVVLPEERLQPRYFMIHMS